MNQVTKTIGGYVLAVLALICLSVACNDNREEAEETNVTQTRTSVEFTVAAADDNAAPGEMLRTLRLIFVNTKGLVEKIIDDNVSPDGSVQSKIYSCELLPGVKNVFLLANFDLLKDGNEYLRMLYGLQEGDVFPYDKMATATIRLPASADGSGTLALRSSEGKLYLPMSNRESIEISQRGPNRHVIHAVRLMDKVNITFHNPSDEDVEIEELRISSFTDDNIQLLPSVLPFQNAETLPPVFPNGNERQEIILDYGKVLHDGKSLLPYPVPATRNTTEGSSLLPTVYVNETQPKAGETFRIAVKGKRTHAGGSMEVEDEMSELIFTDIPYLHRNTQLNLDVHLARYDLLLTGVTSRPPIGGYPVEAKLEGRYDYRCDFTYGGPFTIRTELTRTINGSVTPMPLSDYNVTWTVEEDNPDSPIFYTPPHYNNTTGAIENGVLTNAKGSATVRLEFSAIEHDGNKTVTRVFRYTIHINRL
ncbi:MAG: hypothetical protein NC388_03580 [Clostridium sp.]|nr:hypothetical protein [Clostridium sp.]